MSGCEEIYKILPMKVKDIKKKLKAKGVKRYSALTKVEAIKVLMDPAKYQARYTDVSRRKHKKKLRRLKKDIANINKPPTPLPAGTKRQFARPSRGRRKKAIERRLVEESQARRLDRLRATVAQQKKNQGSGYH